MTENTQNMDVKSFDGKGALWTIAGTGIAIAASKLVNGGFGGILGGGNNAVTQAANSAAILEMARKDAEIAQLKADAATDKKLVEVYSNLRIQDKEQDAKINELQKEICGLDKRISETALVASNGITQLNGAVVALQNTVGSITKCVVPNSSVCPGWGQVTSTPSGSTVVTPTPAVAA